MDLIWIVYFIDVICGLSGSFIGLMIGFITLLGTAAYIMLTIFSEECGNTNDIDEMQGYLRVLKVPLIITWTLMTVAAFIPSEETGLKMLAAYAGQELVQMEGTKEVGTKAYKALNKVLDDYLDEEESPLD